MSLAMDSTAPPCPSYQPTSSSDHEEALSTNEYDNRQPTLLELVRKEIRGQLPPAETSSHASNANNATDGHSAVEYPTISNSGGSKRHKKRGDRKHAAKNIAGSPTAVASSSSSGIAIRSAEQKEAPTVLGFAPLPGEVLSADGKQFIIPHHDAPAARALLPAHLKVTNLASPQSCNTSNYAYSTPQSPSSMGSMPTENTRAHARYTPVLEASRQIQKLALEAAAEDRSGETQSLANPGTSAVGTGLGIITAPDEHWT